MSFVEIVGWVRHFARAVAVTNETCPLDLTIGPEDLPETPEELDLRAFVEALDELTVLRLQTLFYVGRDRDGDPAALHEELAERTTDKADAIETLLGKAILDECLARGLEVLKRMSIDPNGAWHAHGTHTVAKPRDYVQEPVATMPIRNPGAATFAELLDVLGDLRATVLVGANDPDMGPYSRCIAVRRHNRDKWTQQGYRRLTVEEEDQALGEVEDNTADWKHSDWNE